MTLEQAKEHLRALSDGYHREEQEEAASVVLAALERAPMVLVFRWHNDDSYDVELDGVVVNVNHDDHGRDGMTIARDALVAMAKQIGIPVVIEGNEGV